VHGGDAHPTDAIDVDPGVVDEQYVRRSRTQHRRRGGVAGRGRLGGPVTEEPYLATTVPAELQLVARGLTDPKIRPCPGRWTSSHIGTRQDTTRTNRRVRASQPPSHSRSALLGQEKSGISSSRSRSSCPHREPCGAAICVPLGLHRSVRRVAVDGNKVSGATPGR
jgi:hypothetical protein